MTWRELRGLAALLLLPALAGCLAPLHPGSLLLAGQLIGPMLQRQRCPRPAAIHAEQSPEELYAAMTACLRASEPDTALVLFTLAAAYGRYDALRVSDPSAHQAASVLRMLALQNLSASQRLELSSRVAALASDPRRLPDLCARIERIGPPAYPPDYMVKHGLRELRRGLTRQPGDRRPPALVENFDAATAWNRVLDRDVGCSKV